MQRTTQNESCRFPKLEECAHFHYERVQLGRIAVELLKDKSDPHANVTLSDLNASLATPTTTTQAPSHNIWFIIRVTAEKSEPFLIRRSFENMKMLDEMLHRCVYDRKISCLTDLSDMELDADHIDYDAVVAEYMERLTNIISDSLTCGQILTWLQLDNKGQRLPLADSETMKCINTPAVGAAYGIRKYTAQACDEISIEVGDMISVIDMPSPAESAWWRGKKSHLQKSQYEVGFFPQSCVATIGDKVPRNLVLPAPLVGSLDVSPTKPVLQKHGKLIAFFRSYILSRPSRRSLKQSGIYKERVFSCDLSEHLLNSGQEIPMVLKVCSKYIEDFGVVDGIYRLSGITSNIQRLRRSFDEERVPDMVNSDVRQDTHAMSSLLKMYFRELPNPLCTYQLYEQFVEAIQSKGDTNERLSAMKETVQKLPPPHYRTLKYLMTHLNKVAQHSARTGMTDRNLAIVWAPNLLRSPALEMGGVAALRGVGVQAVVTEYLITNCHAIFDADEDFNSSREASSTDSATEAEENGAIDSHELSSLSVERPKSLSVGGARLISLEEAQAQNRHNRIEFIDINKSNPINTPPNSNAYIEVNGGPSSLPEKYHTVLPVPRSWQKRKTHSWKSLFTRSQRNGTSGELKCMNNNSTPAKEKYRNSVSKASKDEEKSKPMSRSGSKKVTKSIEICDTKPMDVCARSTSADSLRTHSRSVSHDSYFDLLQSPLRTAAVSPSREFSELGLNFDREEPEMRIFSESESLVSSPRVPKEMQSKRVTRFRIDDSSAGNSVNPSPKKQPRLNLPSAKEAQLNRMQISDDGGLRKRSKVGDSDVDDKHSLSDIQFIDSITPEHTISAATTTIYACAQIHNPPSSKRSSILDETPIETQLRKLSADKYENKEGRFSYPGMGAKFCDDKKLLSRFSMNVENVDDRRQQFYRQSFSERNSMRASMHKSNDLGMGNHLSAQQSKGSENDCSKMSIPTPSSPSKSPCYSLLAGTSSENSSSLNTPIFDMDMSSATQQFDQRMDELKNIGRSGGKDMLCNQNQENQSILSSASNQSDLRKDLSLDLDKSKMSVDETSPISNKQTSGSTSQSMTPSEFGYHHLNRPSNVVSLDNSPRSDIYEAVEQAYRSNCDQNSTASTPIQTLPPINKARSPIKATINITYNLKSPQRTTMATNFAFATAVEPDPSQFPDYEPVEVVTSSAHPLETTFDDNVVYEQVKFFKGAVSEVNHLLENGDAEQPKEFFDDLNGSQVVPITNEMQSKVNENGMCDNEIMDNKSDSGDVLMPDQELAEDSLEFDSNLSMYENVNLRKPPNTYENITMRPNGKTKSLNFAETNLSLGKENNKSAGNFKVKQLANKFETSPVDAMAPFDFSKPFARKNCDTNRNSISVPKAKNPQHLDKSNVFTRSLDENAFVREFGNTRSSERVNKSTQQIAANILTENSPQRRVPSNDSVRPKSMNQSKRLPIHCDDDTEMGKVDVSADDKNITNEAPPADTDAPKTNVGDDERSKMLGNFKLDRERIERIKEERRLQLNEKFRSESFKSEKENTQLKSKSRNELYDMKDADKKTIDTMQYKSKSRNEIYNTREADVCNAKDKAGERLRQFSDEKNQNTTGDNEQTVAYRTRKFDRLNTTSHGSVTLRTLSQRDPVSPQISIRDVAALFESRSSHH